MKISVEKKVSEEIELETPAFFKNHYGSYIKVTDVCVIQVFDTLIQAVIKSRGAAYFNLSVLEATQGTAIPETEFNEKYLSALEAIEKFVNPTV